MGRMRARLVTHGSTLSPRMLCPARRRASAPVHLGLPPFRKSTSDMFGASGLVARSRGRPPPRVILVVRLGPLIMDNVMVIILSAVAPFVMAMTGLNVDCPAVGALGTGHERVSAALPRALAATTASRGTVAPRGWAAIRSPFVFSPAGTSSAVPSLVAPLLEPGPPCGAVTSSADKPATCTYPHRRKVFMTLSGGFADVATHHIHHARAELFTSRPRPPAAWPFHPRTSGHRGAPPQPQCPGYAVPQFWC